jgi:hypothetical protein
LLVATPDSFRCRQIVAGGIEVISQSLQVGSKALGRSFSGWQCINNRAELSD